MTRLFVDATPLRTSRNFRLLFIGQLVSLLGSNLTIVAVAYQVYQQTHSSLWVVLVSFIQLPLLIVGSLWGGVMCVLGVLALVRWRPNFWRERSL